MVGIYFDRTLKYSLGQSVPVIGMTGTLGAFSLGADGTREAIAILDTGVQANHEFLKNKVILERCYSNGGGGGGGISLCPNGQPTQAGNGSADPLSPACLNNACYAVFSRNACRRHRSWQ